MFIGIFCKYVQVSYTDVHMSYADMFSNTLFQFPRGECILNVVPIRCANIFFGYISMCLEH